MSTNLLPASNLENVKLKVADKIRSIFVDLISDEEWSKIVSKEIGDFTKTNDDRYYGGHNRSQLQTLIRDEINSLFKEKIKKELFSSKYESQLNGIYDLSAGEFVEKFLIENIDLVTKSFFTSFFQQVVNNFRDIARQTMEKTY